MIETIDQFLSFLTVVGQGVIVALIVAYLAKGKIAWVKTLFVFAVRYALLFAFVVALTATLGSLFYSEVAGYEPCKLCWYQRILMYPQVILLGIAWLKRDRGVRDYSLVLSGLGAGLAAYHYSLQLNLASAVSCSVVGYSASCSQRFAMEYGYVTIPLMALTAFGLIIAFLVVGASSGVVARRSKYSTMKTT